MQAYNKAYGALLGALVGALFSIAARHGIGDGVQIYGLTALDVKELLTPVITGIGAVVGTYIAPANKPAA